MADDKLPAGVEELPPGVVDVHMELPKEDDKADFVGRAKRGIVKAAKAAESVPAVGTAGLGTLAEMVLPGSAGEAATTAMMFIPGAGWVPTAARIVGGTVAPAVIGAVQGKDVAEEGLRGLGQSVLGESLGRVAQAAVRGAGAAYGRVRDWPNVAEVLTSAVPSWGRKAATPAAAAPAAAVPTRTPIAALPPAGGGTVAPPSGGGATVIGPPTAPAPPPPPAPGPLALPPIGGTARTFEAGPSSGRLGQVYQGKVRERVGGEPPTTHVTTPEVAETLIERTPPTRWHRQQAAPTPAPPAPPPPFQAPPAQPSAAPPTRFSRQQGTPQPLPPSTVTVPPSPPATTAVQPKELLSDIVGGQARRRMGEMYEQAMERSIKAAGDPMIMITAEPGFKAVTAPASEIKHTISKIEQSLSGATGERKTTQQAAEAWDWVQSAKKKLAMQLAVHLTPEELAIHNAAVREYATGAELLRVFSGGRRRVSEEGARRLEAKGRQEGEGLDWPTLQRAYETRRGALEKLMPPDQFRALDQAMRFDPGMARDVPGRIKPFPRMPRRTGGLEEIATSAATAGRVAGSEGSRGLEGAREATGGGVIGLIEDPRQVPRWLWSYFRGGL